jgi:hypothetical protein
MIGIIPSVNKTFEVFGHFTVKDPIEGKLYVDTDGRIYMYSKTETRSNPNTGYFPCWNGKEKFITQYSNTKFFPVDAILTDLMKLAEKIGKEVADQVLYNHRRCDNEEILRPSLTDGDNMFTQCIKGVLNVKEYTMVDLVDLSVPRLDEKMITNYYSALTKITFMRLDKWQIWMDVILHLKYQVNVYKDDKRLIQYRYPANQFDTGIVKYDNIIGTKDDPFKKIIRILMIMENINKNSLRSKEVDDYTINNMLTTLNSKKSLSAQLFSRFIRMANLSYDVNLYEDNYETSIFEYRET